MSAQPADGDPAGGQPPAGRSTAAAQPAPGAKGAEGAEAERLGAVGQPPAAGRLRSGRPPAAGQPSGERPSATGRASHAPSGSASDWSSAARGSSASVAPSTGGRQPGAGAPPRTTEGRATTGPAAPDRSAAGARESARDERPATADQPAAAEYRIEDLAHLSGATVRTIRAYQDRGLLPRPERRGRANMYGATHLARLRQIADLLDRGYTLASIKELLEAWDAGRGLGGVLGLVAEVDGPWTDEQVDRITRAELDERFGGVPDERAVREAVALGVLEPVPGRDDEFLVPSPQELSVAVELYAAGVPLLAIAGHLRELRAQVEHIATRFLEFTTEHVFARYLGHRPPSDAEATEAAELVRRLRPLAQQTVDAELARAMRTFAPRHLRRHLSPGVAGGPEREPWAVALPAETVRAVQDLVGAEQVAPFIAAAAEREVQARTLDALTEAWRDGRDGRDNATVYDALEEAQGKEA